MSFKSRYVCTGLFGWPKNIHVSQHAPFVIHFYGFLIALGWDSAVSLLIPVLYSCVVRGPGTTALPLTQAPHPTPLSLNHGENESRSSGGVAM